jgi:serine protease Do
MTMSENSRNTNRTRNLATASAVVVALAGGYALRGTQVTAQQTNTNTSTKTPIVQTQATTDAATMQKAFNQVSTAIEPAVVTITTERSMRNTAGGRGVVRASPAHKAPVANRLVAIPEEFFRRFLSATSTCSPNSYNKEQARSLWKEMQGRGGGGLGSGMIYREDGHIITNAHVVSGADRVTVKMNDGREFRNAKVVGSDERTDIAVVKIDGAGQTADCAPGRFGQCQRGRLGDCGGQPVWPGAHRDGRRDFGQGA